MSGNRRENTFRIDYAKVPKKPTYEELHHFLGVALGLKREEVLRLQCSKIHGCAFVKTCDLETAQRVVEEHDGKHIMEVDKKQYTLRMWMEDGGVDVKLHDLSEDVTDDAITAFMTAYGDIISIRESMWDEKYSFGAIPNGIRVVRMIVKKNIPSYPYIPSNIFIKDSFPHVAIAASSHTVVYPACRTKSCSYRNLMQIAKNHHTPT